MTFQSEAATKRTFYIERYGDEYKVIKVWEKGHRISQTDMAFAFSRVMATDPDERIVAEQSISLISSPTGLTIAAEDRAVADATLDATTRILSGERPAPDAKDR